jgi:hypothetical protein
MAWNMWCRDMIIIYKTPLMRRKMHKTREKMLRDEIIWPNWCQMARAGWAWP